VATSSFSEHCRAGDEYARRLREALDSPVAVLSAFVGDRQLFLGTAGLPESLQGVREMPALEGFCKYVWENGCQLVVDDTQVETGIATHPLVVELGVRAYAGWHIVGQDGQPVGVLAAMECDPRAWSSTELLTLLELAQECGPTVRAVVAECAPTDRSA